PAAGHRRVRRLPRACIPRSDHRSRRGRLPDGRAGPGLRPDDHGRAYLRASRGQDPPAGRLGNVLMSREGGFWDVMEGRKPPPPAAVTLGFKLLDIDPERGTIRVQFAAKQEFLNPMGVVQGGFVAAMLDDTLGPALVCTLPPGQFAPTVEL